MLNTEILLQVGRDQVYPGQHGIAGLAAARPVMVVPRHELEPAMEALLVMAATYKQKGATLAPALVSSNIYSYHNQPHNEKDSACSYKRSILYLSKHFFYVCNIH